MPPNDGMDAGGILQAKHCIYTLLEPGRVQRIKKTIIFTLKLSGNMGVNSSEQPMVNPSP